MEIQWRRVGAGTALMFAAFASVAAVQGVGPPGDTAVSAQVGCGPLNGMSFVGKIGPGNNRDRGRFDFPGRVVGGQSDVYINWTQQRWDGDIERKLTFVGAQERSQCRRL